MAVVATSQPHDYGLRCVTSPVEPKLEVIFVHGLGGHRTGTWENSQGDFWPSWLNQSTPTTRVWTYGYNAGLWKDPSQDALDLHCTELLECCLVKSEIGSSNVPVVFVCHSLGGILVKATVTKVLNSPKDSKWFLLKERIQSLVFVATPHRGSEWANRLYMLFIRPGTAFLQLLKKKQSALLATVAEQFNNKWGQRPIVCFREGRGMPILGKIVKPEDARTNCEGEQVFDVPYDHRRIAKVESKNELLFTELVRHIKIAIDENPDVTQAPTQPAIQPPTQDADLPLAQPDGEFSDHESESASLPVTTSTEVAPSLWSRAHLRVFYKFVTRKSADGTGDWVIMEENFIEEMPENASIETKARHFHSGTFTFIYPGHDSTTVTLKVPGSKGGSQADWTVLSRDSIHHPGRHDGRLVIPDDYPFKPPKINWDSPIVSAFVNAVGRVCQPDDYWHPGLADFRPYLVMIASIVLFGPEIETTNDPALCHVPGPLGPLYFFRYSNDVEDQDWMSRVSNLYARAYNRVDDDSDLDIFDDGHDDPIFSLQASDAHRKTSVLAIEDVATHMWPKLGGARGDLLAHLERRGMKDLHGGFQRTITLRSLLSLERKWVDNIEALTLIGTKGWKVCETYAEHAKRLGNV